MSLLNAATNCLNKYEDETVNKFITLTNTNWIDPMKSQNMNKKGEEDGDDAPKARRKRGDKDEDTVVHASPGLLERELPPGFRKEFPTFDWTLQMAKDAAMMSRLICEMIEAASSSKGDASNKRGKKNQGGPIRQGRSDESMHDVVARALPELWIEDARQYLPLYILYRHAFDWRRLDLRSVPDKSWSYAYRLTFAFRCHELTWGRMIHDPPCRKLRDRFFEFLSARASPFATDLPDVGRSDVVLTSSGGTLPPMKWVNWDNDLVQTITQSGKKHGLLDTVSDLRTPRALQDSAKRWQKYELEAKKIVNAVHDCIFAQDGNEASLPAKTNHRRIHPVVADRLCALLEVRTCIASSSFIC